jgi:hypothetical protein
MDTNFFDSFLTFTRQLRLFVAKTIASGVAVFTFFPSKALSISSQRGLISDSDTLGVVQVDE